MFYLIPVLLVIFGIVFTASKQSLAAKKQEEARKQKFDERQYDPVTPPVRPQTPQPIRPSVQVFEPVRKAVNAAQPAVKQESKQHPQHDLCALREEKPVKNGAHPQHDMCALDAHTVQARADDSTQPAGTVLNFTPDNILRGVIFAEVFGKPKALR